MYIWHCYNALWDCLLCKEHKMLGVGDIPVEMCGSVGILDYRLYRSYAHMKLLLFH